MDAVKLESAIKIPALIRRNTLLLAASQALVGIGTQMVPALGAIMVVQLLGSASLSGIATSILGMARFVIAYPIGKVTDAYGRKVGVVIGQLLGILGALLTGIAMTSNSFALFVLGILILGLGIGAAHQLRLAAADMYPPARRAEGLGYVLTGSLIGAFGGPLLIGTAQASAPTFGFDPIALSWMLLPAAILPSVFLVLLIRPDPKEIATHLQRYYPGYAAPPAKPAARAGGTPLAAFLRQYPKLTAFATSFGVQGNMTMIMAMTSLALHHHGHALAAISLAVAIHVLGMFGFSLPIGLLADRFGRRALLLAGVVLCGAGAIIVPASASYWITTAGTFLVGLGWSCVNVAASALIADTTPAQERGRAVGTNDTFASAAAVLFPLVGGLVVELGGLAAVGILGVALVIPPLILIVRLKEASPGVYGTRS